MDARAPVEHAGGFLRRGHVPAGNVEVRKLEVVLEEVGEVGNAADVPGGNGRVARKGVHLGEHAAHGGSRA